VAVCVFHILKHTTHTTPASACAPFSPAPNSKLQGKWKAKGLESNTVFTDIELSLADGSEWFEYDAKAKAEVSIQNMKWEIAKA